MLLCLCLPRVSYPSELTSGWALWVLPKYQPTYIEQLSVAKFILSHFAFFHGINASDKLYQHSLAKWLNVCFLAVCRGMLELMSGSGPIHTVGLKVKHVLKCSAEQK